MQEATIIIPLESAPQSKQSVRLGKKGAYTCPKKKAYQNELIYKIRSLFKGEQFKLHAVINMEFGFKPPKKLTEENSIEVNGIFYKTTTPDYDNIDKPVLDALTKAGVLIDDKIAYDGRAVKRYSNKFYIKITIKGV